MANLEVEQKLTLLEIDGEDTDAKMGVDSHWNYADAVVLHCGRRRYTVNGNDLKAAIDNAMNVNR